MEFAAHIAELHEFTELQLAQLRGVVRDAVEESVRVAIRSEFETLADKILGQSPQERLHKMLEEHQQVLLTAISESASRAASRTTQNSTYGRRLLGTNASADSNSSVGTLRPTYGSSGDMMSSTASQSVSVQQNRMQNLKETIMRGTSTVSLSTGTRGVRKYATRLKESRWFDFGIAVCIAANTVSIGFNADWSIKHPGSARPTTFMILDYSFLGVFALELLVRVLVEGMDFFKPGREEFSWNMFDTLIIVATSLNELNPLKMNLSVVRALRPLRLVHAVRLIRILKAFRELRMMVTGILNCGKTLIWSIILLSLVSYIYSVFCLQICADWLGSLDESVILGDPKIQSAIEKFDKHFSSLPWCAYNLFKAMTNGITWGDELGDPMFQVGPAMVFSFVLYITATVLCVLNIITASFVEAAARTRQNDDANTLDHIHLRTEMMDKITELFNKHDCDKDGYLNWQEFKAVAMDWRTQAFFRELELDFDFQNARQLFRLFDWDKSGQINIDEFAQGIHHLRGTARSLDMFREFQRLGQRVEAAVRRLERGETRTSLSTGRHSMRQPGFSAGDLALSRGDSPASDAAL